MAYPTTPELMSLLNHIRESLDNPCVGTHFVHWDMIYPVLPKDLIGSPSYYLQEMARTFGMVVGKGDENNHTAAFCLSEFQPERREVKPPPVGLQEEFDANQQ